VCEHLPLLAAQMHHVALVRSVHHTAVDHNAGSYYALTGRTPNVGGRLIVGDEPDNFPPFGAVLARYRPVDRTVPRSCSYPTSCRTTTKICRVSVPVSWARRSIRW